MILIKEKHIGFNKRVMQGKGEKTSEIILIVYRVSFFEL
jgi:hypothetical protein